MSEQEHPNEGNPDKNKDKSPAEKLRDVPHDLVEAIADLAGNLYKIDGQIKKANEKLEKQHSNIKRFMIATGIILASTNIGGYFYLTHKEKKEMKRLDKCYDLVGQFKDFGEKIPCECTEYLSTKYPCDSNKKLKL